MWYSKLHLKRLDKACICPICGHKSYVMMKVGHEAEVLQQNHVVGAGLRYAQCIWCGSTDRDRLVYIYLINHCAIYKQENVKILHIAPERCLSKVLRKKAHDRYVPADINPKKYWYIKGMNTVDITHIRFEDNSFDIILCNHVLEHVPNDNTAISELYRVLRPRGIAVLQVPIAGNNIHTIENNMALSQRERLQSYGQKDHVRLYGQDYVDRLKKTGGVVHTIGIAHLYPEYGLNPDEQLFFVEKLSADME